MGCTWRRAACALLLSAAAAFAGGGPAEAAAGPRIAAVAGVPADALPTDSDASTKRVLLSSASQGVFELAQVRGAWQVRQSWRGGHELPAGVYGDASYGDGGLAVALLDQGVVRVRGGRASQLDAAPGWPSRHPLTLLGRSRGGFWVAFAPLPFGSESGSGVLLWDEKVLRTVPLNDRALATIGRWVEVVERKSVFAATPGGVIEIGEDGSLQRHSSAPVASLARDPRGQTIVAAGSAVTRWDGQRWVPVLFGLDLPGKRAPLGHGDPIDVAIDGGGCWYLLYAHGLLAVLDRAGATTAVLTTGDGIPSTARRLLAAPNSDSVLVGSTTEGLRSVEGACAR
ncbi:MAG TPA: hypothetical protein VGS57_01015 [Thermoanaerobaculia bacterium]|nr:hypothetical protein [Thermoanaerobaculia bacterium]